MPVVNDLDSLGGSSTPITEDQLHKLLNAITLKIHNILHGDGYLGAIDHEEFGDTGHRVYFSNSLVAMQKMHAYYSDLLASPEKRGDFAYVLTQSQTPQLVTGEDDTLRLQ